MGNVYVNSGNANIVGESNKLSNCNLNSGSKFSDTDLDKVKEFICEIEKNNKFTEEDRKECVNSLSSLISAEQNNEEEEVNIAKEKWKRVLKKVGVNTLSALAITSDIITVGTPLFTKLFIQ